MFHVHLYDVDTSQGLQARTVHTLATYLAGYGLGFPANRCWGGGEFQGDPVICQPISVRRPSKKKLAIFGI